MRYLLVIFTLLSLLNAKELERVSLQLSSLDQFEFAGYYVAKEKGFYEESGLDVEIKKFTEGIVPVYEVNEHRATYGIGRSSLVADVVNGAKIKLLSAIFQASPLVLIAKKDSKIRSIKDFVGKKIMTQADLSTTVSINAIISRFNLTSDMVELDHKFNIDNFIDSKTDLMIASISNEPYILKQRGVKINIFDPKEYGFDFYSDILFTNDREVKNHYLRVNRVREASLKGWRYVFSHIDESVDLIYEKYNPEHKTKEALLYEAKELKKLAYYKTDDLGKIDKHKIQRIYDIYNVMGILQKSVNIDTFLYGQNSEITLTKEEREYLKSKKEITVCVKRGWLPYEDIQKGKFVGLSADYLNLITSKLSLELKIKKFITQDEVMHALERRECDIKPIMDNKKSVFIPYTSTHKILHDNIVLVTDIEQPFVNDLKDLKERVVMVKGLHKCLRKYIHDEYPGLTIVEVKDTQSALNLVADKKIYGYIGTSLSAAYNIQEKYTGKLKILNDFRCLDLGIGVINSDGTLLRIFNKTINSIEPQESKKILNRWLTITVESQKNYLFLLNIVVGLVVILFIVLYFLKKQSILNKKLTKLETSLRESNKTLEEKVAEALEKNNHQHQQLLQQSRQAQMGEMISMIAHQWRQPLGAISATTLNLRFKLELGTYSLQTQESKDECNKYFYNKLKDIESYVSNLSLVIDDFRNFYRPNKHLIKISFKEIVEKSLNIIKVSLESENIELELEYNSVEYVEMHDGEMMQVVLNILKNAQDNFREKSIEYKKIAIKVDKKSLTISDNGGGIEEAVIDDIFDPYFSTKDEKNGTGLGLYMSKIIVNEHHKGKLSVKNIESGVMFKIEL
jgi:signal transduction histidine kinase/ABC-type nitrate/sulfonate/bicarbonate transport system substrate-binding protein